ncbi:hypothetical protein PGIGA_G00105220, partial [Pangasianodon gigas]|nr:hypothetical protein [Pangasianodon gigas]
MNKESPGLAQWIPIMKEELGELNKEVQREGGEKGKGHQYLMKCKLFWLTIWMSMREAGQRVQPNLSRHMVASINWTFKKTTVFAELRDENQVEVDHGHCGSPLCSMVMSQCALPSALPPYSPFLNPIEEIFSASPCTAGMHMSVRNFCRQWKELGGDYTQLYPGMEKAHQGCFPPLPGQVMWPEPVQRQDGFI